VREQFAADCTNDYIRERFLHKPNDRTLENLQQVVLTLERAQHETPVLGLRRPSETVHLFADKTIVNVMRQLWPFWGIHRIHRTVLLAENSAISQARTVISRSTVRYSAGLSTHADTRNGRSRQRSHLRPSHRAPASYVDEAHPLDYCNDSVRLAQYGQKQVLLKWLIVAPIALQRSSDSGTLLLCRLSSLFTQHNSPLFDCDNKYLT